MNALNAVFTTPYWQPTRAMALIYIRVVNNKFTSKRIKVDTKINLTNNKILVKRFRQLETLVEQNHLPIRTLGKPVNYILISQTVWNGIHYFYLLCKPIFKNLT